MTRSWSSLSLTLAQRELHDAIDPDPFAQNARSGGDELAHSHAIVLDEVLIDEGVVFVPLVELAGHDLLDLIRAPSAVRSRRVLRAPWQSRLRARRRDRDTAATLQRHASQHRAPVLETFPCAKRSRFRN